MGNAVDANQGSSSNVPEDPPGSLRSSAGCKVAKHTGQGSKVYDPGFPLFQKAEMPVASMTRCVFGGRVCGNYRGAWPCFTTRQGRGSDRGPVAGLHALPPLYTKQVNLQLGHAAKGD